MRTHIKVVYKMVKLLLRRSDKPIYSGRKETLIETWWYGVPLRVGLFAKKKEHCSVMWNCKTIVSLPVLPASVIFLTCSAFDLAICSSIFTRWASSSRSWHVDWHLQWTAYTDKTSGFLLNLARFHLTWRVRPPWPWVVSSQSGRQRPGSVDDPLLRPASSCWTIKIEWFYWWILGKSSCMGSTESVNIRPMANWRTLIICDSFPSNMRAAAPV